MENAFSKYMHLHNVFQDEQIKPLWVSRGTPGIHAQYTNVGVYTDYDSVVKYHTGRPSPKGKLILHETTTPLIEVAEDGETAQASGLWLVSSPVCRSPATWVPCPRTCTSLRIRMSMGNVSGPIGCGASMPSTF